MVVVDKRGANAKERVGEIVEAGGVAIPIEADASSWNDALSTVERAIETFGPLTSW